MQRRDHLDRQQATRYARHLVDTLPLKCKLVPYPDVGALLAAVISGHADAGMGSFSVLAGALDQRKVVIILDTRDPAAATKYLGKSAMEGAGWGLRSTLERERSAMSRCSATFGPRDSTSFSVRLVETRAGSRS